MKLIVGLGNPGKKYEGTRHNAGFFFIDRLSIHPEITTVGENLEFKKENRFEARIAETINNGEKILLVKPETYMNLSGKSVKSLIDFYKIKLDDLIVVSDDIDIPVGYVRVRNEGSSGGQKGLENIIETLGTDQFTRVRIGIQSVLGTMEQTINKPDKFETVEFVLSQFSKRELPLLDEIVDDAIEYILPFLSVSEKMPAHTLSIRKDSL